MNGQQRSWGRGFQFEGEQWQEGTVVRPVCHEGPSPFYDAVGHTLRRGD